MTNLEAADLLTTAQVAALKGVTVTTVNRWARAGILTAAIKVPGRTGPNLYRRTDVEDVTDADNRVAS